MKKLILSAAFLLLATPHAFAAGDTEASKDNSAMMKHCQSMMKDGKMMDGMPKQMTDKCKELMKNDNMQGMKMDNMQLIDKTKTDPSDTNDSGQSN